MIEQPCRTQFVDENIEPILFSIHNISEENPKCQPTSSGILNLLLVLQPQLLEQTCMQWLTKRNSSFLVLRVQSAIRAISPCNCGRSIREIYKEMVPHQVVQDFYEYLIHAIGLLWKDSHMHFFSRTKLMLFALLVLALLCTLVIGVLITRSLHTSLIGVIDICQSCRRVW